MEENKFTYTQLNFWSGRLYYPITRFLSRVKPDIFVAQEVLSGPGDSFVDQMTAEMLLNEKHQYFDDFALGGELKEFRGINRGYKRTEHCATFVKGSYKIISSKVIPITSLDQTVPRHGGEYYNLLHTMVELKCGKKINVLNYHGEVIMGDKARMGSSVADHNFQQISDYISHLSGPIVISGDFNLDKGASSLKFLKNIGLINLNDLYNIGSAGRNEFSWRPDEMVSHIFISNDIIVDDYYVADDNVSDHKALIMTASIKE